MSPVTNPGEIPAAYQQKQSQKQTCKILTKIRLGSKMQGPPISFI